MTAPISPHVREGLKTMRDAMIELLLLAGHIVVRLADTFRDDLRITLLVTSVLAVRALHTRRILEEVAA